MRQGLFGVARRSIAATCTVAFLGLSMACTAKAPSSEKLDPALEQYVLEKLPDTVEHKLYLDFGGKVQLLGYDVSPAELAAPGSTVNLTLYWQRTGKLDDGWGLFTHILDEHGRQIAQRDSSGPLRADSGNGQALGPSDWQIGKVYVDELSIEIPKTQSYGNERVPLRTPLVTLAVGVWKDMARLDVLGGNSDAHRRGFVTTLKTGVERSAQLEEDAQPDAKQNDAGNKDSDG